MFKKICPECERVVNIAGEEVGCDHIWQGNCPRCGKEIDLYFDYGEMSEIFCPDYPNDEE